MYVDGHKREDVVAYRQAWAKRMMGYKKQMETYSGEIEEIVTPPLLHSDQKQIVMVTYDESTFYANDGKQQIWIAEGETVLRKKTLGQSNYGFRIPMPMSRYDAPISCIDISCLI